MAMAMHMPFLLMYKLHIEVMEISYPITSLRVLSFDRAIAPLFFLSSHLKYDGDAQHSELSSYQVLTQCEGFKCLNCFYSLQYRLLLFCVYTTYVHKLCHPGKCVPCFDYHMLIDQEMLVAPLNLEERFVG